VTSYPCSIVDCVHASSKIFVLVSQFGPDLDVRQVAHTPQKRRGETRATLRRCEISKSLWSYSVDKYSDGPPKSGAPYRSSPRSETCSNDSARTRVLACDSSTAGDVIVANMACSTYVQNP
jgi:hypothetical protein